jgi:hypothetical protein
VADVTIDEVLAEALDLLATETASAYGHCWTTWRQRRPVVVRGCS